MVKGKCQRLMTTPESAYFCVQFSKNYTKCPDDISSTYSCQFYVECMEEQFDSLCVFDGGDTFV